MPPARTAQPADLVTTDYQGTREKSGEGWSNCRFLRFPNDEEVNRQTEQVLLSSRNIRRSENAVPVTLQTRQRRLWTVRRSTLSRTRQQPLCQPRTEVRPQHELDDFEPTQVIGRFRKMEPDQKN